MKFHQPRFDCHVFFENLQKINRLPKVLSKGVYLNSVKEQIILHCFREAPNDGHMPSLRASRILWILRPMALSCRRNISAQSCSAPTSRLYMPALSALQNLRPGGT